MYFYKYLELDLLSSINMKHFFWRLCTNTLRVCSLLNFRHLTEETCCPWCNVEVETVAHVFVECERVKDLWDECNCSVMSNWGSFSSWCDLMVSWKSLDAKMKQRGMFLAWCISGERNLKVFENKITPNDLISARVYRYVDEFGKYATRINAAAALGASRSPNKWCASPANIIKLNADATLAEEAGWEWVRLLRTVRGMC